VPCQFLRYFGCGANPLMANDLQNRRFFALPAPKAEMREFHAYFRKPLRTNALRCVKINHNA